MNKLGVFVVSFMAIAFAQAQSYKCKQENGQYIFSDRPCVTENQVLEKIKIDYQGVIVYLSTNPEPAPLPSKIVNHFLDDVSAACQAKDGGKVLSYFSTEAQEKIERRVIKDNIFGAVSNVCSNVNSIKQEIEASKDSILFASRKPHQSIELCLYTAQKGIENCLGNMKIIAEKGDLKLDAL